MNQHFNFRRFWLLIRLDFTENGKGYLISSALFIGLMLLMMTPILATETYHDLLGVLHMITVFLLLLGGSLFTSTIFSAYSTPAKGIPALMIPASRQEKFMAALLINMLFMLAFFFIFWQLHYVITDLANQGLSEDGGRYHYIPAEPRIFFTYCYFLIQGAVFLGSIYFPKNAYIKTLGILLVLATVTYIFNHILALQLSDARDVFTFPFSYWKVFNNGTYVVNFPDAINIMVKAFLGLLVVGLWYITYIRLKEKEI